MKGVTFSTTSQCGYIDLILCLPHNRLLNYGIETEMYGRKLSLSKS